MARQKWPARRFPKPGPRKPTPPPLLNVDVNDDQGWYYGENAGGAIFSFGAHKRQKSVNDVRESYLTWCTTKASNIPYYDQQCINRYLEGLQTYATTNYKDFVVPFGRTYLGLKIRQCRDKGWLEWILYKDNSQLRRLREDFPVFFSAVENWLANPRHEDVKRDVGRSLRADQYGDDLNLQDDSDEEEETQSDRDFIDDSGIQDGDEDEECADDNEAEDLSGAEAAEPDGAASQESSPSTEVEEPSAEETAKSEDERPAPVPRTPRKKRRTRSSKKTKPKGEFDDFIEEDDNKADGSASYQSPERTSKFTTPRRETRYYTKKKAELGAQIRLDRYLRKRKVQQRLRVDTDESEEETSESDSSKHTPALANASTGTSARSSRASKTFRAPSVDLFSSSDEVKRKGERPSHVASEEDEMQSPSTRRRASVRKRQIIASDSDGYDTPTPSFKPARKRARTQDHTLMSPSKTRSAHAIQ